MRPLQLIAILGAAVGMSACSAGLTQMQDTVTKFDQGAHAAGTAEMSLLHQVQAAECSRNFYAQAFSFATAQKDKKTKKYPVVPLDLTAACTHQELTDAQLEIRQKLMDTITLYADAIQTLANGTDDTNLSKNSQSLASNIQGLAKQQGFTAVTATDTAALNAAVVTITSLILDHTKYKEIKDAASSVQPGLTTVVAQLKAENLSDAEGLASKAGSVTNEFYTALLSARDQRGPASFLDVVQAHMALQSIVIASPNVAQLNDTLDALVAANEALARATNGGAIPEISDLVSRAQQAVTLFNSSK
jgi:hypothetical protein